MAEPRTHDYTSQGLGHSCTINRIEDGGMVLHLSGFGRGISAQDYIVLPNGNETTRYRMDEVSYQRDPADMWRAVASFAPRPTAEPAPEDGASTAP